MSQEEGEKSCFDKDSCKQSFNRTIISAPEFLGVANSSLIFDDASTNENDHDNGVSDFMEAQKKLEHEKDEFRRQLFVREKEVESLVRRCQSQEEKCKQASKLRASNNELVGQLEGVKSMLSMKENECLKVEKLKKELRKCHEIREELRVQLEKLKRDHKDTMDTLNSCFENMQRQEEKQKEYEDECKRKLKHKDIIFDTERISYLDAVNNMKADLHFRQKKIEKLEMLLRQNNTTIGELKRENLDLKKSLEQTLILKDDFHRSLEGMTMEHLCTIQQLTEVRSMLKEKDVVMETMKKTETTFERQLTEIRGVSRQKDTVIKTMKTIESQYDRQLSDIRTVLKQKNEVIETLEKEVSKCMQNCMTLSEEKELIQNKKILLQQKNSESLRYLEKENRDLAKELAAKDLDLAVVSTSLAAHEDERKILEKELKKLGDLVLDNKKVKESYDLSISEIHVDFENQKKMWVRREQDILGKMQIFKTEAQKKETEFQSKLAESQDLLLSLRCELKSLKETVESLGSEKKLLEENRVIQASILSEIESKLSIAHQSLDTKKEEYFTIKNQLDQYHLKSNDALSLADKKNKYLQNQVVSCKETISSYESERKVLSKKKKEMEQVIAVLKGKNEKIKNERDQELKAMHLQLEDFRNSARREKSEERQKYEENIRSLQEELIFEGENLNKKNICLNDLQHELDHSREVLQNEVDTLKMKVQEKENIAAALSEKINCERDKRATSIREILEKSEFSKNGWQTQLSQAHTLLQEKRGEIETLQLQLLNMSSKIEQDAIKADRTININLERLNVLEQKSDTQQREIELKSSEVERLKTEIQTMKELAKKQTAELHKQIAEKERFLMTNEFELQKERSIRKGKESTLDKMGKEIETLRQSMEEQDQRIIKKENDLEKLTLVHNQNLRQQDESLKDQVQQISKLSTELSAQKKIVEKRTSNITVLKKQVEGKEIELCQMKKRLSEHKSKIHKAEKKLSEQMSLTQSLQNRLKNASIEEKENQESIKLLNTKIEEMKFKFEQHSSETSENKVIMNSKFNSLESIKANLEQEKISLVTEMSDQKAEICSMSKTIELLKEKLAEKDDVLTKIIEEEKRLRESNSLLKKKQQVLINEKDKFSNKLKNQLKILEGEKKENLESTQILIMSMKQKLQKAEIDLAISQDEIRDLRMIDLHDAEETINQLESILQKLRVERRNDEISTKNIIADLEEKIDQLSAKLEITEKCKYDEKNLYKKNVSRMEEQMNVLRGEIETLNHELEDRFEKLTERHNQITAMTSREAQLESRESALIKENEDIKLELQKINEEKERNKILLSREIEKHRANCQEENVELRGRQTKIQKELNESKNKLNSLQKQKSEVEELLVSRSKLLADMVSHNKEMEELKKITQRKLEESEKSSSKYKLQLENCQMELSKNKIYFTKKEDQLISAVRDEREKRDDAEAKLDIAIHKLQISETDNKELIELSKENEVLRDKVRRQGAFLKRKLQKDKVVRGRNSKCILTRERSPKTVANNTSGQRLALQERNTKSLKNMIVTPVPSSRRISSLKRPSAIGFMKDKEENLFGVVCSEYK